MRASRLWTGLSVKGKVWPSLAFFAMAIPAPAQAYFQDLFQWSNYSVRLGAATLIRPAYEGASSYKLWAVPAIDIRWKKVAYLSDNNLRIDLARKPWLSAGPMLTYDFGRPETASTALRGLGNVGDALAAGGYADVVLGAVGLTLVVEHEVVGGYGGFSGHFDIGYQVYHGEALSLAVGTRVSFAGSEHMQAFFGITPAQSARSGLPVYTPGAGIRDIGIGLVGDYLITKHWTLGGLLGYARVVGGAAHSPLVQDLGSANQVIGYLRLSYLF